jgi:hypothetical protein
MADFKIFYTRHIILNAARYYGIVWLAAHFITYSRRKGGGGGVVKVTMLSPDGRDILASISNLNQHYKTVPPSHHPIHTKSSSAVICFFYRPFISLCLSTNDYQLNNVLHNLY